MKKFIAGFLCLILFVSIISAAAYADDPIAVTVKNGTHEEGSGYFVIFMIDAPASGYSYATVDGVRINASAVSENGKCYVALKPQYVESLSGGEHIAKFYFGSNVTVDAKFTVVPYRDVYGNPQTGDNSNIALWTVLALCAAAACAAIVPVSKKVTGK